MNVYILSCVAAIIEGALQTEFFTCKMVVSSFSLRITSVSLLVHHPYFALHYDWLY